MGLIILVIAGLGISGLVVPALAGVFWGAALSVGLGFMLHIWWN